MTPLLSITDLSHRFADGSFAFSDVSLQINKGELIILTGRNGSGKSYLLQHCNGLYKPFSGTIMLNGKDIFADISETRRRVGYIFQNPDAQIIGDTVLSDVAFGLLNLGYGRTKAEEQARILLRETGLEGFADRSPHTLSGGEKRRLAVAGVMIMNPDIVIFDEPFENLDYEGTVLMLQIITNLHKTGKTVIVVTHDLEKMAAHATRLIAMEHGKIVFDGTVDAAAESIHEFGVRPIEKSRIPKMSWLY